MMLKYKEEWVVVVIVKLLLMVGLFQMVIVLMVVLVDVILENRFQFMRYDCCFDMVVVYLEIFYKVNFWVSYYIEGEVWEIKNCFSIEVF